MEEIDYNKIGVITVDPIEYKIIARTEQGYQIWERAYEIMVEQKLTPETAISGLKDVACNAKIPIIKDGVVVNTFQDYKTRLAGIKEVLKLWGLSKDNTGTNTNIDARSVTYNVHDTNEELANGLSRVVKQLKHWEAQDNGNVSIRKPTKK